MWDQRYKQEGFAYGKEANDFLKSQCFRIPKGGKVLCLAEGEGRNAIFLARQGYLVTAVDQSAVGLQKATEYASEHDVQIVTEVADLADYDLGHEVWDAVISIAAHVPLLLRESLHTRVVHSLKDNGIFILEGYTARHLDMPGIGGPPASNRDWFMSLDKLQAELAGLDLVLGHEIDKHVSEGKYHQGESAVVQLIACKTL